jgi:glycosyltransferase involved in cell wall biosynthesis
MKSRRASNSTYASAGIGDVAPLIHEWRLWRERRIALKQAAMPGIEPFTTSPSTPPCPIPLVGWRTSVISEHGARGIEAGDAFGATRGALLRWNAGLAAPERKRDGEDALLAQARWIVAHEVAVAPDAVGWPLPVAHGQALSASMQGLATSVLARAYLLTGQEQFIACARQAARTFALDILDGGVCAPVGSGEHEGIVFEATALYPAAHTLEGFLVAILSLYDFVALTGDVQMDALAQQGHDTLHDLLSSYDTGYRTRLNLSDAALAGKSTQMHLTRLLAALAACSECDQCQRTAERWARYPRSLVKRLRFQGVRARDAWRRKVWVLAGRALRVRPARTVTTRPYRVCVPITAYPVGGGMRAVIAGWRQAMECDWKMAFLTAHIGPDGEGQTIYSFAPRGLLRKVGAISPFQFPSVLRYMLAGFAGLLSLLRRVPDYVVLLPQDGVFTAAFTAFCAKLAGHRMVIVDHGNIHDLYDPNYAAERLQALAHLPWRKRKVAQLRLALYLPTLRTMARFAARHSDHILAASDDVVKPYQRYLGVPAHRITRFPFMLDATRYALPDTEMRANQRATIGLSDDAIVIIMVNRLHPVKGVDVGVAAMRAAVAALPPHLRARVRILMVGDGVLRDQVAADIRDSGLADICRMWGEASADEVAMLLGISDIFLFTARRSINSMAVLEAMAAGCATIATVTSPHIAAYLGDHRGITVPVGDVDALANALCTLLRNDQQRQEMGKRAQDYVVTQHIGAVVRRHLLRATYWQPDLERGGTTC